LTSYGVYQASRYQFRKVGSAPRWEAFWARLAHLQKPSENRRLLELRLAIATEARNKNKKKCAHDILFAIFERAAWPCRDMAAAFVDICRRDSMFEPTAQRVAGLYLSIGTTIN